MRDTGTTLGGRADIDEPAVHPAGPAPAREPRGELAELGRMLLRTVLPVGAALGVALAVYGSTGHDLTTVLQDRFPEDSEFSGLFTITFSSALLVCAGVTLGAVVAARAWLRTAAGSSSVSAIPAGLAVSVLLIVIGFDDMMMVHDAMVPGGAGIPESVGLAAYGLVGAVLMALAFRPIRREGLALCFLGGLGLLAGSLGGDVLELLVKDASPALSTALGHAEDITKFLAYAALCHLCLLLARRISSRTLQLATEHAAREAAERTSRGTHVPVTVRSARGEPIGSRQRATDASEDVRGAGSVQGSASEPTTPLPVPPKSDRRAKAAH